ncbi:MAG: hypothetical protein K0Q49_1343 [Haloplasmataceae bacterium]|jgi:hypothetical protein|nr:hypothetical protein [Haloplasmataceae bacterium]
MNNNKNANNMKEFLQKKKGGNNKTFTPVVNNSVKKLNSTHRKLGK